MFFALIFSTVTAMAATEPRCEVLSQDVLKKTRESCQDKFEKTSPPPDGHTAKELCNCVADSIGEKLSCDELKRYRTDRQFAADTDQRIARACVHDSKSKTP